MNTKTFIALFALSFSLFAGVLQQADALPYPTTFDPLNEGFTQEVYGIGNHFFGGVAFAPDGDPLVNSCVGGAGIMDRFDTATTFVHATGTVLHTSTTPIPSFGCGLSNHPDGFIYANTNAGVIKMDETGTEFSIAGNPLGGVGAGGNALGIAVQPGTNLVYYVNSGNDIEVLDTTTGISSLFLNIPDPSFIDEIVFSPDGSLLWLAQRSGGFRVQEIDTTIPALNPDTPLTNEPDGMALHIPTNTLFVNTLSGTLERVDLSVNPHTVTIFASGGFRGDLAEVGPDGCMYLTQAGTNFDDGSVGGENSLVRICPDFAQPPGVISEVGGEILSINSAALMIAGIQSSAIWMLPALAIVAGAAGFYLKTRKN